jgi:hypothetical protein
MIATLLQGEAIQGNHLMTRAGISYQRTDARMMPTEHADVQMPRRLRMKAATPIRRSTSTSEAIPFVAEM